VTATREELEELSRALEGALGIAKIADPPVLDENWRKQWSELAGTGVAGCCVPEDRGGLGMEAAAALVASRVFGTALHGAPYPAIVAAGYALSGGLTGELRAAVCEAIVSGESLPALAFLGPGAQLREVGGEVCVTGRAQLVLGADDCDSFLLLPADATRMLYVQGRKGCSLEPGETFDVTRSTAAVVFGDACATPLLGGTAERSTTERLYGLLLAGDALGGLERMLERTRAYALDRIAFGKPIGAFQAVQHRLVDHTVRVRGMSLLALDAAGALTEGADGAERRVLLAESAVASGAVHVLHDLLQLTGAIGFTWEHGLHFYERRAHLDARLGRNPRQALQSLVELEGWARDVPAAAAG